MQPERSLLASAAIDFVAREEFDFTVAEVAEGRPLASVDGISYRDASGQVVHNADREILEDMDRLPFVTPVYKRDLRPEDYYIGYLLHPYLSLYTGRGCRSRCTFCLWPQTVGGHRYRTRSVEHVLAEAALVARAVPPGEGAVLRRRHVHRRPGPGRGHRPRAGPARDHLVVQRQGQRAPRDRCRCYGTTGCACCWSGYESGNQQILINIKKGLRVDRARRFAADCRELGITVHGTFILGLPGETRETIQETIRFAREVNPHTLQVSVAAPYPGTELHRQAVEKGWLPDDDDGAALVSERWHPAGGAVLPAPGAHRDPGLGGRVLQAVLLPRREAGRDVGRVAAAARA